VPLHLGFHVEGWLPAARPPAVAGDRQLAELRCEGRIRGRRGEPEDLASTSSSGCPRRALRALRARSIWRTSSSRAAAAPAPVAGGAGSSSDSPPRPMWSYADPRATAAASAHSTPTATAPSTTHRSASSIRRVSRTGREVPYHRPKNR
jgi:hypothetical protein